MTVNAQSTINLSIQSFLAENPNLGIPLHSPNIKSLISLAAGTGAGQVDIAWTQQRTLASGATDSIDLNGTLKDAFGVNMTIVTLCGVIILNTPYDPAAAANTTNLTIGAGSNPFLGLFGTGTFVLRPGGAYSAICGGPGGLGTVTPGTADILTIINSAGASNSYQIGLLGRST